MLPVPSISQPRIHVVHPCGPDGPLVGHGAFLPVMQAYLDDATPNVNHFRNVWTDAGETGYGFQARMLGADTYAEMFAKRCVLDQLDSMRTTWGLADNGYNLYYHIPTGHANLASNAGDGVAGTHGWREHTPLMDAGVAAMTAALVTAGYPAALKALLDSELLSAFYPGLGIQDIEHSQWRSYHACASGTDSDATWGGTGGNDPDVEGDGRSATENLLVDVTGPLAMTAVLGHATARTFADLKALRAFGNTNLSWNHASNIAASRIVEGQTASILDNALARSMYAELLTQFPGIICGNYDVPGLHHPLAPYSYHDWWGQAGRNHQLDIFKAGSPVLYPPGSCMMGDTAALSLGGWGSLVPSLDPYRVAIARMRSVIAGCRATKAAYPAVEHVPWLMAPDTGADEADKDSDPWDRGTEFFIDTLTEVFRAGIFKHLILWRWENNLLTVPARYTDFDLIAWCLDQAAARVGFSWAA